MDRNKSREWDEEDLQKLVSNQIEEDSELEYKACASLKMHDKERTEISKDVSSFANSGGGFIIYGICEKGHIPERIDDGFDPDDISKEWLDQVIQGGIHPRIDGVHINPIALSGTSTGKIVYVVTIPQGVTAHQAADKKYYKRFNFNSEPMHDFEIRDVMNRQKTPLIEPAFSFSSDPSGVNHGMSILLKNKGSVITQKLKLIFTWPTQVPLYRTLGPNKIPKGDYFEFVFHSLTTPIFPEDEIPITELGQFSFRYVFDTNKNEPNLLDYVKAYHPKLNWRIFADNMPPRAGEILLEKIPGFRY